MSLRRRMPAAAIAALLAMPLAACSPTQPTPSPTPTAPHTPLFASDAEALKAATDAYAAYQHVSNTIANDGGKDPDRIRSYVTADQLPRELKGFEAFSANHRRTTGSGTFDSARLGSYDRSRGAIELFLCQDTTGTRVLDQNGQDVTPADRPARLPMDVFLQAQGQKLLVARSEVWSGKDFC
ncbi:hypothetical protein GCM10027414_26430 [Humibacter ginsengiterrae]